MLDLAVEGVQRLRRMTPFGEQPVAYEPLSGLVDGTNTRFRARKSPVKTGSTTVYVSSVSVVHTLFEPDVLILAAAPVAQPYASYTHQPLSDLRAKQLLIDGVTELEMRWPRRLRLSSSAVAYVAATESDSNIYVMSGSSVADPSDDIVLSTSENQKGLILNCAMYVYRLAQLWQAAQASISIRGTAGGMTLDRRTVPSAMLQVLAMHDQRLRRMVVDGQIEWTGGESLGGIVSVIHTRDYMQNYEWQTSAILEDWYSVFSYDPSDVDLEAIE